MILDDILARTRADLADRQARRPLGEVEAEAAAAPAARSLARALRQPPGGAGIACIAEFKRRSPSAGWIREGAAAADIAARYARAGAAALSILTDEPFFGGSLDDLAAARRAVSVPLLRKDFVVAPYQIAEARAAGADAVLLIVAALDDGTIADLLAAAARYGVEALVEAHDAGEARRAVRAGAAVIGINNRDLRTFTVDRELAVRLRADIPPDRVVVAESGIRDAGDVARLRAAGVDAMLVGETLMRAPDPGAALSQLLAGES